MGDNPKVGVVTVTYNSENVIDGFLSSMLAQSHGDFLLYVIDNASSDRTLEKVGRYNDERIIVIRNSENAGVARGNNQGIRAALGAHCGSVLLINNDTEFGPELLQALHDGLQRCQCDMIVPKINYYSEPDKIWYAGGHFDRWKGYMGIHERLGETDSGRSEKTRLVEYAPTCCMLIRCDVFSQVGLMDEQFFVYADDTDFCFRASRSGLKLVYLADATLLHKVSSLTGAESSRFTSRHLTRSHIYFIRKNFGFWRSACYLAAFQLKLFYKLLWRVVDWDGFWVREKAFFEGWKIPLSGEVLPGTGG